MRALSRAVLAMALPISVAATASPAAAQVQVTLRPLAGVEAIYLADFLPGGSGVRPDLIGITIVNPERSSQAVSLELVVARESPSPIEIFRGTSEPFALREAVRHLTFRDLVTSGREGAITDYEVNADALDDERLRIGRLPPGTYVFTVSLRTPQGTRVDRDELRITLSYPSRVELLAPGAPADTRPPTLPDATPRFVWSTDGEGTGAQYRLRVVRVDDAASPVEAVQGGFPVWETVTSATSVFYPASVEAVRLEPGATYAWQVTREVRTSGGVEPIESPVYWFRVGGAGTRTAAGAVDLRFAALLRALGLSELDGFTPVGATLEDGRVVPLQVLEELLAAIEAGEVPVLSVRVR